MADILIAEDDAHMMRILSMWLSRNGHRVVEAANGLAAQQQLRDRKFQLLVSDVNMPGLDGISLVRWLRREHASWIPVILLTSRCDQAVLAEELAEFDVRLHPKPFSPSRLASEIEERLGQEEERDEGTEGRRDGGTKGGDVYVAGDEVEIGRAHV